MSVAYLLTSLPTLELGAEAPFSPEEYRRRCEGIGGLDLGDFDAVVAGTPGSHPFTVAYANVLSEIKNTTALMRARGWEGENIRVSERSFLGCHAEMQQKITEACNMKNPYEREMALEKARWQMVEELAGISYFSEAKIYAYIVKLQINNRLACLNDERGKAAIEEFIKTNDIKVAEN